MFSQKLVLSLIAITLAPALHAMEKEATEEVNLGTKTVTLPNHFSAPLVKTYFDTYTKQCFQCRMKSPADSIHMFQGISDKQQPQEEAKIVTSVISFSSTQYNCTENAISRPLPQRLLLYTTSKREGIFLDANTEYIADWCRPITIPNRAIGASILTRYVETIYETRTSITVAELKSAIQSNTQPQCFSCKEVYKAAKDKFFQSR